MVVDVTKLSVERYVAEFDRKTEVCTAVYDLHRFNVEEFREAFNIEDEYDPMYQSYRINPVHQKLLAKYLPEAANFDFKSKHYFLEAAVAE